MVLAVGVVVVVAAVVVLAVAVAVFPAADILAVVSAKY